MFDRNRLTVRREFRRAFGPECPNRPEPLFDHRAEPPGARVIRCVDLVCEPKVIEQRYRFCAHHGKASVRESHEKIEYGGRSIPGKTRR